MISPGGAKCCCQHLQTRAHCCQQIYRSAPSPSVCLCTLQLSYLLSVHHVCSLLPAPSLYTYSSVPCGQFMYSSVPCCHFKYMNMFPVASPCTLLVPAARACTALFAYCQFLNSYVYLLPVQEQLFACCQSVW